MIKKSGARFQVFNYSSIAVLINVILCLSLGFIGTVFLKHAYLEIKSVEFEDTSFISFKIVCFLFFLTGLFLKRIYINNSILSYLELSVIILIVSEIYVAYKYSSGILQVDYIFNTNSFQFFTALNFLAAGIFVATLKKFRLWAFLIGSITVSIYIMIYKKGLNIDPNNYLVPTLFVFILEICIFSIASRDKNYLPGEIFFKNKKPFEFLFFGAITLTICHLYLYYRTKENPDAIILGGGFGILIFNILYHYNVFHRYARLVFLASRGILFLNLCLTLYQSDLNFIYYLLFFIDGCLISYFKPARVKGKLLGLSFIFGIGISIISYHLQGLLNKFQFRYSMILLYVVLVWFFYLINHSYRIVQKIAIIILSYIAGVYLFSPLSYSYHINLVQQETTNPYPFLFSNFNLNQDKFIYYKTNLPFKREETLPKINSVKDKVIALGIKENGEVILTYVKYLDRKGLPFLIFQDRSGFILSMKGLNLKYDEYPLFRVYYNSTMEQLNIKNNSTKKKSQSEENIDNKLRNAINNEEIIDILNTTSKTGYGEIVEQANLYKKKFYDSYSAYAEYFFKTEQYGQTIIMANLAFKFNIKEDNLLEYAFESILRITPEEEHLGVMNTLAEYKRYREQILKRLYPVLISLGRRKEAIEKINELINFYENIESSDNEIKTLKVEKAKIFIHDSNIREAEELITGEYNKNRNSIVWNKLMEDLKHLKESLTSKNMNYQGNPDEEVIIQRKVE